MERERLATTVGALVAVLVIALTAIPYLVVAPTALSVYYGSGPLGPPTAALLATLAAVAGLGADRGSADPAVAAGAATVFAVGTVLVLGLWTSGVSAAVVGGMTVAAMAYHRWALLLSALVVAAAMSWAAREIV